MRQVIKFLGISIMAIVLTSSISNAQCSAADQANGCISSLQNGFTFLKTFKVDGHAGAKPKVEYSYVFSKDTEYFLNICNDGEGTDGIIVTMYDSKRQMVSTNFYKGKFYPDLTYPCNATGIYYLTFTFQESQNHCGGSVLGFKR
jgi:hypothetical protein